VRLDVNFDRAPGIIARQIFKIENHIIQEQALQQCPADKVKKVRHHLDTFRKRKRYCEQFNVPFWL